MAERPRLDGRLSQNKDKDGIKPVRGQNKGNSMKSTFNPVPALSALLVAAYSQEAHDRIVLACQGEMNDPEKVTSKEGDTKWNEQIKGGHSYTTAGKLKVTSPEWKESTETVYVAKLATAPLELVKFNGQLVTLFKKCGEPTGPLSIGILPRYVRDWTDKVAAKLNEPKPAAKDHGKNGKRETTPAAA